MEYLFMCLIAVGIAGLLVCVPISVSLWAVLGQSNFLCRLTAMIVCVLVVGAFLDTSSFAGAFLRITTASVFLVLCLAVWAFPSWIARALCVAALIAGVWMMMHNARDGFFDRHAIGAAAIAMPLSASLLLTFRLLGFRFVRLTGNMSDSQIELGTGKNLDQWLAELQAAGGEEMTRVEVVAFFQGQGVPFTYQRALTDAFEMATGRRILKVTADGRPQTVLAYSGIGKAAVQQGDIGRSRWSVSQLMILSSVAAGVFALARAMQIQMPDVAILSVMTLAALCCSVIAIPVLVAELSVQTLVINRIIYLVVALAVAASFPRMIGLWPRGNDYLVVSSIVMSYTAWLVAAVILVRHNGCRIVLVGRPQPHPAAG